MFEEESKLKESSKKTLATYCGFMTNLERWVCSSSEGFLSHRLASGKARSVGTKASPGPPPFPGGSSRRAGTGPLPARSHPEQVLRDDWLN